MIAYLYPPFNYSGAIRAFRFVKYLEKLGHPVTVLAAGTEARPSVQGIVHRVRGDFEHCREEGVAGFLEKVLRRTILPCDWGNIWAFKAAHYGARLMAGKIKPVVISTSPPLPAHWVALWFKLRYGVRWIADFRDPFVGETMRTSRRARYTDPFLERFMFRHADLIIANTDVVAESWKRRYPEFSAKIHLIWNGFDPEENLVARPIDPRSFKVLSHVGSIYGARHPGQLLAAVDRLIQREAIGPASVRIRLVGPLDRTAFGDGYLLDRLTALGCVECVPQQIPRREAQDVMATSDALLLLDMLDENGGVHVAAKLYEYVRVGRPILVSTKRNSATERILIRSGIPYMVIYPDDSDAATDEKVLDFLRLPNTPASPSLDFEETFAAMPQAVYLSRCISGSGC